MINELTGKVTVYRESENGNIRFVAFDTEFDLNEGKEVYQIDHTYFKNDKLYIKIEIRDKEQEMIQYLKNRITELEEELEACPN